MMIQRLFVSLIHIIDATLAYKIDICHMCKGVCPNGIETDDCSNSIVPFTSVVDHLRYGYKMYSLSTEF